MKKTIITGALATALIATGATGLYNVYAKEAPVGPNTSMAEMMNSGYMADMMKDGNMSEMMNSGNFEDMQKFMQDNNMNFGQMKPYLEEMYPNLSDKELEQKYKEMHGTGGACGTGNQKAEKTSSI